MLTKHICVRFAGMTLIVPDVVRVYTQTEGEELVDGTKVEWDSSVSITRANGRRFTLNNVTEVTSIFTRKQE